MGTYKLHILPPNSALARKLILKQNPRILRQLSQKHHHGPVRTDPEFPVPYIPSFGLSVWGVWKGLSPNNFFALQPTPISISHSSVNFMLNKCLIKKCTTSKTHLSPSFSQSVIILVKSSGFLCSFSCSLGNKTTKDSDHSCNYKNSINNHDQGGDSQRLKTKCMKEPMS